MKAAAVKKKIPDDVVLAGIIVPLFKLTKKQERKFVKEWMEWLLRGREAAPSTIGIGVSHSPRDCRNV